MFDIRKNIDLTGKTALITGGGGGIGRGIAEAFASLHAQIVIAEIDPERAAAVRKEFEAAGVPVLVEVVDVRSTPEVKALAQKIGARFGQLDILVNNVGSFLFWMGNLTDCSDEQIDALYAINLKHMFVVSREMIPLMRVSGKGGSIINVSSVEGHRGLPNGAAYSSFKAAVGGFTRALSVELGRDRIRVNELAPDTTETESIQPLKIIKPEYQHRIGDWVPLGRYANVADAAGCAVFLASDLSAWVTGSTVHMNGGTLPMGNYYRGPNGWTTNPIITDDGIGMRPE